MTVEALSFPGVSRRLNLTRAAGVPWCSKNVYGPSEVSWRSSRFPATAPDSKSLYRRELWIREKAHGLHLDRQPRSHTSGRTVHRPGAFSGLLGSPSHAQNDIVLKGLELNRDLPPTLESDRLGMGSGHRRIEGRVVGAGVKRERYRSADGLPGCWIGHLSRVGKISNVLLGRPGEDSRNQVLGRGLNPTVQRFGMHKVEGVDEDREIPHPGTDFGARFLGPGFAPDRQGDI